MTQPPVALGSILLLALAAPPAPAQSVDTARQTSQEGRPEPVRTLFERPGPVRTRPAGGGDLVQVGPPGASFLTTNQDPEGDMPRALAFTPDGSEVVIANRDTDTLTFFDVATRTITDTVAVGDFPVDVAVTPDGQYAVVPNPLDDTVSVVDVASRTVAATVAVTGDQPYRVAVTSDSAFAVVGVINDGVASSVSVIDLASFLEVRSFATTPQGAFGFFATPESGIFGNIFTAFALSPDDVTLVLPDLGGSQVGIYDITTGAQTALLATAASPTALDISSDGLLAVIEHEGGTQTISTIDLTVPSVTNTFVTPNNMFSQAIRVTPDKTHAIAGIQNAVQFVNLSTGAVSATVSTGTVGDIEISFDGQYAFVSNFNSRVIDIATQIQVASLSFAACADAAASPVEHRMAALNNRFAEDVQLYNTNGGASFFEGFALSGEPVEGDAPRRLAISGDGETALVAHNTSRSAALIDVTTGTVRAYASTGTRSFGCAISADGATGVVTNAGADTLSVIDLASDTTVANVPVPAVPTEVVISPDGQTAYVTSVAGTDRLYFVNLAGAASSVSGSLVTGQLGSILYTYNVASGIALSPDGSVLAVCVSFDDELLLVDTQTQSEITRVPVGDFPIRVAFSPDGARAYVTNSFSDDLYAVDVNGALSSVAGTVGNIEFPLQVDVDDTGAFAYVGSFNSNNPRIRVVDTAALNVVKSVQTNTTPRSSWLDGSNLYVTLTGGELVRIDASGAGSSLLETVALSGGPSDLVFSESSLVAVCAQPGVGDGVDLVPFVPDPETYCTAAANSAGPGALISASGSTSVGANTFTVDVTGAPVSVPSLFYYGSVRLQAPFGDGFRCVGGTTARLFPPITTDGAGAASRLVDFTSPPAGSGPKQIFPGSTWNFQLWYRDVAAMGAGFNLSDGLGATFVP